VAYGIDFQAISNAVGQGKLTPAAGPIPPFLGDWSNPNVKPYPYDPDRARALIAEATEAGCASGLIAADRRGGIGLAFNTAAMPVEAGSV
jgi:peptide/nickel transport system substrate-binding protein